jgi:hypothetical protein
VPVLRRISANHGFIDWNFAFCWVLLALLSCGGASAAPFGTITIADGKSRVTRAVGVHTLAEGGVLEEGDLIELDEGALLQVELGDGSALSFTSKARALLPMPAGQPGRLADVLLLQGWVKVQLTSAAQLPAVQTPLVRLISQNVSYVLSVGEVGTQLFVENGELVPAFASPKSGQPAIVKAGEFLGVRPDSSATVAPRAPQDFVKAMPRPYIDKLPVRLAKLKARNVELKHERDVNFADADGLFKLNPAGRKTYLVQFRPLLKDKAFLRDLEPAIKNYPEWDRIVHPEKYLPKPKPKPPVN